MLPPVWALGTRVQRVFAFFVELVLEFEALVVGFGGLGGFDDGIDVALHVPFAKLPGGDRTVAGIVIGKAGIPPNAGVEVFRKMEAILIGAGFAGGAAEVDEIGARKHGVGGFVFTGMVIDAGGFFRGCAGTGALAVEDVNDIVAGLIEQSLREEGKEMLVAAVAVDNDDFLAAVAGHLVGGFLKELELEAARVSDRAGFVPGFENLAEIVFGEDEREFLLRGLQGGVADVEEIGSEGQMRAVLFENAEGEEADTFGLGDGGAEAGGGEFFPADGKFGLGADGESGEGKNGKSEETGDDFHGGLRVRGHFTAGRELLVFKTV